MEVAAVAGQTGVAVDEFRLLQNFEKVAEESEAAERETAGVAAAEFAVFVEAVESVGWAAVEFVSAGMTAAAEFAAAESAGFVEQPESAVFAAALAARNSVSAVEESAAAGLCLLRFSVRIEG